MKKIKHLELKCLVKVMNHFNLDMETDELTGKDELCVYTDCLPEILKKQIEHIINSDVTTLTQKVCDHFWHHYFVFS